MKKIKTPGMKRTVNVLNNTPTLLRERGREREREKETGEEGEEERYRKRNGAS